MGLPCGSARYREPCSAYCRAVERDQPCGTHFEGYLRPAGLLDGPLKVTADRGRFGWTGRRGVEGTVRIIATHRNGSTSETELRVPLRPGWG
jgi:hypothetical protein